MRSLAIRSVAFLVLAFAVTAAQAQNWVTSWAASVQGPYPCGQSVRAAKSLTGVSVP